ncbi:MAG: hypothetical protein IJ932_05000 [Ruminococcus sp.]|nr:hypothetical protein [Ruminococcus sp.]
MKRYYTTPSVSCEELASEDVLLSSIPSGYRAQYFTNPTIPEADPNNVFDD